MLYTSPPNSIQQSAATSILLYSNHFYHAVQQPSHLYPRVNSQLYAVVQEPPISCFTLVTSILVYTSHLYHAIHQPHLYCCTLAISIMLYTSHLYTAVSTLATSMMLCTSCVSSAIHQAPLSCQLPLYYCLLPTSIQLNPLEVRQRHLSYWTS